MVVKARALLFAAVVTFCLIDGGDEASGLHPHPRATISRIHYFEHFVALKGNSAVSFSPVFVVCWAGLQLGMRLFTVNQSF